MPEIDEPNAVDVEAVVDANVEGDGNEGGADNPVVESTFSKWDGSVNDRTKFKDVESLKKSFDESGRRIAELTPYEKAVKRYGVGAEQLPTLLDELIALRAEKNVAKAPKADAKPAGPAPTKEQEEIRAFLAKELPELGFVNNAQIEKLQAEIKELREGSTSHQEARIQSLIEEGQSTVAGFLTEAKIEDPNGKKALVIETLVRAAIEGDKSGDYERRFFQGGREMKFLLKELSDQAIESLGWTPSVTATTPNAAAATALAKGRQIVANKTLPKADSASKAQPGAKPKQKSTDHIRDRADQAWEEYQAALK